MIEPGSTIGILGGGQLGRMTAMAAAQLGYRCIVLAPEDNPPAGHVVHQVIQADYENTEALDQLAEQCDVITLEFENVPAGSLRYLEAKCPVRPGPGVLAVTQDRLAEKSEIQALDIEVARFLAIDRLEDLQSAKMAALEKGDPFEAILKTRRFGYDGKGQMRVDERSDLAEARASLGNAPCILETLVDFKAELSVIAARTPSGVTRCYPPVENRHANHILKTTIAPFALPEQLTLQATQMAERIAHALAVEGLIAVEMFLTKDDRLLVNELAPRPHNSGHWTIDGAPTSQFEQLIRAICDLPLGATDANGRVEMTNLLGSEWQQEWLASLEDPQAHLHLYGKSVTKDGRKMGHVTRVFP